MCGHVGVFGAINRNHKKMFTHMLFLDILRGKDGTGVFYQNHAGDVSEVIKTTEITPGLIDENSDHFAPNLSITANNLKILMGHNRAATRGKVDVENSHPFEYSHLVGAHNGTLDYAATGKLIKDNGSDMDSRALFNTINAMHAGDENWPDLKSVLEKATGAMALIWFEKETEYLHIYRNKERPLYVAGDKHGKVFFWASEAWMLECSAKMAGVVLDDIGVYPVNTHHVLEFKNGKVKIVSAKEHPVFFTKTTYYGTHGRGPGFGTTGGFKQQNQQVVGQNQTQGPAGKKTGAFNSGKEQDNVVPITNIGLKRIPTQLYEELLNGGCSVCRDSLEEVEHVYWFSAISPVCPACMEAFEQDLTPNPGVVKVERKKKCA